MWVVVPLALRPKSLDSLVGCLLQPADDLFGGYHLFGHLPEVDKRRLVAVAQLRVPAASSRILHHGDLKTPLK